MWLPGYQSSMLCLGQHQRSRLIMSIPLHKPYPQKIFLQRTPFCWSLPSHDSICTSLHSYINTYYPAPLSSGRPGGIQCLHFKKLTQPLLTISVILDKSFCLTASLAPHSPAPWLSFYLLYTRLLSFIHAHHQLFPVNKGWYQLLLMQKLSEGTTIGSD
jgi:hypothetical protein